jgi:hypothetical protein
MIEPKGKDKVWLSFGDWDPDMMALASKLHSKSDPAGETVLRNHEVGIDQLSNSPIVKKPLMPCLTWSMT